MIILGIETSCDETAAAVLKDGVVLSNIIASQIDTHKQYGGVYPEIASRLHIENIRGVVQQAVEEAGIAYQDIDAVGVTAMPGLIGALLVGVNFGKSLAFSLGKPVIAVNHVEAHIAAALIENGVEFPAVALVASGGHTSIYLCEHEGADYELLAKTRDDAAGEAFDKVARTLGLDYPGGPSIQKAAVGGDINALPIPQVRIEGSHDFSFSGIKTKVLNHVNKLEQQGQPIPVADIAASFQHAVAETLSSRLIELAEQHYARSVILCGGVAANELLRKSVAEKAAGAFNFIVPQPIYCTDNAAMVAKQAGYHFANDEFADISLNASSR